MKHTHLFTLFLTGALTLSLLSACGGKDAAETMPPSPSAVESAAAKTPAPTATASVQPTETPAPLETLEPSPEPTETTEALEMPEATEEQAEENPTQSVEPTEASQEETIVPTETPSPTAAPEPTPSPEPPAPTSAPETPSPTPTPESIPTLAPQPVATLTPPVITLPPISVVPPAPLPTLEPAPLPTPEPTPTPPPAPAQVSVSVIWNAVSGSVDQSGLIDLGTEMLSALYGINANDIEEYVAKIPAMSATVNEVLIARVKSGRMDAVKQGVLQRQSDLLEEYENYLPDQLELVKNYKLAVSGDYILFCIGPNAAGAVSAFQNLV